MQKPRPAQILAVTFALAMLSAYVVYSQNRGQQTNTVLPSSKSRQIDGAKQQWALEQKAAGAASAAAAPGSPVVASSSKVLVPVVTLPSSPPAAATNASVVQMRPRTFLGGSKSGAMIVLEQTNANPQPAAATNAVKTPKSKP